MPISYDIRLTRFADISLLPVLDLATNDAASVILGEGADRLDIVVVRQGEEVAGFINECPHAGTPLETFDGGFLDTEDDSILVCSTHGARFRAADGHCVGGICLGLALKPVPVVIVDGMVRIDGRSLK